ncbi:MAG: DNA-binding protein [Chloroflexi bacterium]|nr:MAG: DNA-binding protein [Chloroflexota bacterium]
MATYQKLYNDEDVIRARIAKQHLSRYIQNHEPVLVQVKSENAQEVIELPADALALLVQILDVMASGRGVTLIPEDIELTTVQAAEILRVSRPFLIKLLEEGKIPHRKVGKHRRIRLDDVLSYKEAIDREREAILDQLAAEAQEHEMGYGS